MCIRDRVRPSGAAAKMAEQEGVDIRKYSVIYDAIEEVKAAMAVSYTHLPVMPSRVMLPDPELLAEQVLLSICLSLTSPEP